MARSLIIDAFSGISGDMVLGALVDLGVDPEEIEEAVRGLEGLEPFRLEAERVERGVFAATRLHVRTSPAREHRHHDRIVTMIGKAPLAARVKERASKIFERLAGAEAKVHGMPVESVHFHEVGAVDSIIDVVGTAIGLEALGVERIYVSRVRLGKGEVECQHGRIPVPSPATLEILEGVTVHWSDDPRELVTPTGAAILSALAEPLTASVAFRSERVGYGAGAFGEGAPGGEAGEADHGHAHDNGHAHGHAPGGGGSLPNVLRLVLARVEPGAVRGRTLAILETSLDDMNPEHLGWLRGALLARGALEVFVTPIQMKKDRPGFLVTVLSEPGEVDALAGEIFRHSTTFGLRVRHEERLEMPRRIETVETRYGPVRVKIGSWEGREERVSPEFESARALAEERRVPLHEIYRAAEEAWRKERES